jgi:hypothetical protein
MVNSKFSHATTSASASGSKPIEPPAQAVATAGAPAPAINELTLRAFVHEAARHSPLDEKERLIMRADLKQFDRCFDEIIKSEMCDKLTVLSLVEQTMLIGIRCNLTPERLKELQDKLNSERVGPAHNARRADDIQNIIVNQAEKLWKRKPWLKGSNRGAAAEIWKSVLADVTKLKKMPKDWERIIHGTDSKRTIDTIARRIARTAIG